MLIEDIIAEWDIDCKIDRTDLGGEQQKIPKLHNKYYKFLVPEKLKLRRFEAKMKELKLEKYEFYTQGPTEETIKKGWKLPPKGMILKADIPMYMEADKDIIELSLKIGYQQEVVEFLDSILKSFTNRGYNTRSAIDWERFIAGG